MWHIIILCCYCLIVFQVPLSSLSVIGSLNQCISSLLPVKHSVGQRESPRWQGEDERNQTSCYITAVIEFQATVLEPLLLSAHCPHVSLFLGSLELPMSPVITAHLCRPSCHFYSFTSKLKLIRSDLLLSKILKLEDILSSQRMRTSSLDLQKSHFQLISSPVDIKWRLISIAINCTYLTKQYSRPNEDYIIISVLLSGGSLAPALREHRKMGLSHPSTLQRPY